MWDLPESPRFLVASQRLEEAKVCLQTIARSNKKSFSWDATLFIDANKKNVIYDKE